MNEKRPDQSSSKPAQVDDELARHLVSLAMEDGSRDVQGLVSRMQAADGERWFLDSLSSGPLSRCPFDSDSLQAGELSLDNLRELKEASKLWRHEHTSLDTVMVATQGYVLSLAAALVFHGEWISRSAAASFAPMLLDVAEACPAQWTTLLAGAAVRIEELQ